MFKISELLKTRSRKAISAMLLALSLSTSVSSIPTFNHTIKAMAEDKVGELKPVKVAADEFTEAIFISMGKDGIIKTEINGKEEKVRLINNVFIKNDNKDVAKLNKEAIEEINNSLKDGVIFLQKDKSDKDGNKNLLRYLWVSKPDAEYVSIDDFKSNCLNSLLLADGYTSYNKSNVNEKYNDFYDVIQKESKNNKVGIWNILKVSEVNEIVKAYKNDIESKIVETSKEEAKEADKTKAEDVKNTSNAANESSNGKIKGNPESKIYHLPGGQYYDKLKNPVYFDNEEEAKKAGYRKSER